MRPVGTVGPVRQALLEAVRELVQPNRGPTLLEMAAHAQVGRVAVMSTVDNMVRSGDLVIARRRWVAYCRKPVAEYAPASPQDDAALDDSQRSAAADLAQFLDAWAR